EWVKYVYGVFPEHGFKGDELYPYIYSDGFEAKLNSGCPDSTESFCSLNKTYNHHAPSKQNLLCNSQSSIQTLLRSQNLKQSLTPKSTSSEGILRPKNHLKDSSFSYVVGKTSSFSILLDRSSIMGRNHRWTNIKRAFYRLFQLLPAGTRLSIISFGSEAVLDLHPTVLSDSNREGLHGRIPRKVLENEDSGCVPCALNLSLRSHQNYLGETRPGNIILVSGSLHSSQESYLRDINKVIMEAPIRVFPVIYPAAAFGDPNIVKYSKYGKQSAFLLSETLMDIFREAEGVPIQKVYENKHSGDLEVSGTFTLETELRHKMSVTLSIEDEERVELFEITNPSGEKHLFSKFEDGMVIFNVPKKAEAGIWTYHAKLYPDANDETNAMSVDVVSQARIEEPIILEAFASPTQAEVDPYDISEPVIIYARLTKGPLRPVLNAYVIGRIHRPKGAQPIEIILRDNGLGYPDITKNDGIYSAYFTEFAEGPGFYGIEVSASHNEGLARTPKSLKLHTEDPLASDPLIT
ncbi:Epithelial chloride channel proteinlike, partial [Caligus rogercresseyi]